MLKMTNHCHIELVEMWTNLKSHKL